MVALSENASSIMHYPEVESSSTATSTTAASTNATSQQQYQQGQRSQSFKPLQLNPTPITHVSDPAMEFLIAEILHYAGTSCPPEGPGEERAVFACEMAAAKLERIGYSVGYRLCERLAQNKTFAGGIASTHAAHAAAQAAAAGTGTMAGNAAGSPGGSGSGGGGSSGTSKKNSSNASSTDPIAAIAASQLEAVKFLCKEFWMEVFRKQIDKLQTNHRGVFVLKDLELRWLTRFPNNQEIARVTAIQLLAYPCGMLRGALSNLGIPAVVSCDFLTDGQNMASCSFNIKIK